ncbi:hypothetical protein ACIHCQ_17675 [Streptomyces sp. NPDC052236]|uniref:hypothetical protein n=1 Tax=Streptomyces sp. NPDC052236 TaxID=3365686 RepID=UPI0037D013A4
MRIARRLAAVCAGAALALGGLTAVAPAAHATAEECVTHVSDASPSTDKEEINNACEAGAEGDVTECVQALTAAGIKPEVAKEGCTRAAQEED